MKKIEEFRNNYEILVVGAGHGGLVAAAHLAEYGHKVDIFEKNNEENLGWDWRDHIPRSTFKECGIPPIPSKEIFQVPSYTFISPDLETEFNVDIPQEKREIGIERRRILKHLVDFAKSKGVNFHFSTKVIGPLLRDNIISGITIETFDENKENLVKKEIEGKMVIDAAGLHSPIRENLPDTYNIQKKIPEHEIFFTYRAYYPIPAHMKGYEPEFRTYFKFNEIPGIAWYQTAEDEKYFDILIGQTRSFRKKDIEQLLKHLREIHPQIGYEPSRGGIVAQIPVRRPLDLIVGHNYALVGDSATMAKPLNGSGMYEAMIAGKLLSERIVELSNFNYKNPNNNQNKNGIGNENGKRNENAKGNGKGNGNSKGISYPIEDLWAYQYRYYHKRGAKMAYIDLLKRYLLGLDPDDLSFIFKHQLITPNDMVIALEGRDLRMTFIDLLGRILRGIQRLPLLLELKNVVAKGKKLENELLKMPIHYDKDEVKEWRENYNRVFNKIE